MKYKKDNNYNIMCLVQHRLLWERGGTQPTPEGSEVSHKSQCEIES